jgi:FMN-dependent oxidoreductase (nitrilotriacetate monooxygenase family)
MDRPMIFNFFVMNTPSHITHGTWRKPGCESVDYNNLDMWVELAKLAESAKIDGLFFADVFGLYAGPLETIARHAIQFPISDPSMLISAMAYATKNLGFVYTNSVLQAHPFAFARAISTLDHLTKGRVGWNVVTSASDNGSRSMGLPSIVDHDERYRWAEEYIEVVYKLWEGSWEDGAIVKDAATGVYADASKIHKIHHKGERYSVEGPHLVEPSPQRTPVLFQAGASTAGLAFAAKHTEGAFLISGAPEASARKIAEIKKLACEAGRNDDDILFIEGLTFVVGSTEEEARRKEAELEEWMSDEAQMTIMGGGTGLDVREMDPDTPLVDLLEKIPGMRGGIQLALDAAPEGTPETIADRIQDYREVGVNGINIMYMDLPGTYRDFVDYVAPVLKDRGLMQREYREGTFREKLYPGRGSKLEASHPAIQYRTIAS